MKKNKCDIITVSILLCFVLGCSEEVAAPKRDANAVPEFVIEVGEKFPCAFFDPFTGALVDAAKMNITADDRYWIWIEPDDPEFAILPEQINKGRIPKDQVFFFKIGNGNKAYESASYYFQTDKFDKIWSLPRDESFYQNELVFVFNNHKRQCVFQLLEYRVNEEHTKGYLQFRCRELLRNASESHSPPSKNTPSNTSVTENGNPRKKTETEPTRSPQIPEVVNNHFRKLFTAIHSYQAGDVNLLLPQDIVDGKGNSLLSWRVQILRELDYVDLYNQFHLNEPWDSPHNIKLIKKMPPVFASPDCNNPDKFKSHYHMTDRKKHNSQDLQAGSQNRSTSSSEILLLEVKDEYAHVWTKPDCDFTPQKDEKFLEKLRAVRNGEYCFLLAGGGVIIIHSNSVTQEEFFKLCTSRVPPEELISFINRQKGEVRKTIKN